VPELFSEDHGIDLQVVLTSEIERIIGHKYDRNSTMLFNTQMVGNITLEPTTWIPPQDFHTYEELELLQQYCDDSSIDLQKELQKELNESPLDETRATKTPDIDDHPATDARTEDFDVDDQHDTECNTRSHNMITTNDDSEDSSSDPDTSDTDSIDDPTVDIERSEDNADKEGENSTDTATESCRARDSDDDDGNDRDNAIELGPGSTFTLCLNDVCSTRRKHITVVIEGDKLIVNRVLPTARYYHADTHGAEVTRVGSSIKGQKGWNPHTALDKLYSQRIVHIEVST
jgi:hypothetical protein